MRVLAACACFPGSGKQRPRPKALRPFAGLVGTVRTPSVPHSGPRRPLPEPLDYSPRAAFQGVSHPKSLMLYVANVSLPSV